MTINFLCLSYGVELRSNLDDALPGVVDSAGKYGIQKLLKI